MIRVRVLDASARRRRALRALLEGGGFRVAREDESGFVVLDDEAGMEREPLTLREREVLVLLSLGLTNREIAARLGISAHTAKFHVSSIFGKLGAGSRAEAVSQGIRDGLIPV
jgi:DNA-binding CsgD family transcriptional regulator